MKNQMCLEWRNLEYSVSGNKLDNYKFWKGFTKPDDLQILNKVNGCINTGSLTAILGASGAGKTTLLAAISQRLRGNIKGEIFINGTQIKRKEMSRISCFLPQTDTFIKCLTAFEHLFLMCHFKMDRRTSKVAKIQKVKNLLFKVGLKEVTMTKIVHLSGGERKRLSLAEQLINDPPFVFCDEPTTGLDSYNAFSVIQTLRQLTTVKESSATPFQVYVDSMEMQVMPQIENEQYFTNNNKRGVLCSVHQPTSDVFELFTHIILMSSGRIVYQGSSDDACLFFSRLGYMCPKNCNPADFYIKMIADDEEELKISDIVHENYEKEIVNTCPIRWRADSYDNILITEKSFKPISWIAQICFLLLRSTIETKRNFLDVVIKVFCFMLTAIILAIMYSNVRGFTQSSVQDIQGSIFMLSTEMIFTFSYSVIYELPSNLPKIRREVGENIYTLSAFYVAQVMSLIPKAFFISFIFFGIVYPSVNYAKDMFTFFTMSITLTLSAITGTAYGLLLSTISETNAFSAEIAAPFDFTFLLLGGMYNNINNIPYAKYISLFYYTNEALTYDYWHDIESIDCLQVSGYPCLRNGTEVLQNFSFHTDPYTISFDYIGLGVLTLIMHSLAFLKFHRYVRRAGYY